MKTIVRVEKNKNYTVVNNTSLHDERLSWKAKAIHLFMLSRPDNWVFRSMELTQWAKDGRDAFNSGLKELQQFGYVKKVRRRNARGEFEWLTTVYEIPCMDNPSTENPCMANPSMETPQLLNTNLVSTNLVNTDLLNNDDEQDAFTFYQVNGFGKLTTYIKNKIEKWINQIGQELVIHAMKRAIENNVFRWSYVETTLQNWLQQQVKTIAQAEAAKQRLAAKKTQSRYGKYVETVPKWFYKEPPSKETKPSIENEDIERDLDAEMQRLLKEFREMK